MFWEVGCRCSSDSDTVVTSASTSVLSLDAISLAAAAVSAVKSDRYVEDFVAPELYEYSLVFEYETETSELLLSVPVGKVVLLKGDDVSS